MRRKDACHPGRFDLGAALVDQDDSRIRRAIQSQFFGFGGATNYYYRASSMRVVVGQIRVPGDDPDGRGDDPFVPTTRHFADPAVTRNPRIQVVITKHGGHCGFLGPATSTAMATGPKSGSWSSRWRNRQSTVTLGYRCSRRRGR
jgi:predicted alpha/beta-fold hydrolase